MPSDWSNVLSNPLLEKTLSGAALGHVLSCRAAIISSKMFIDPICDSMSKKMSSLLDDFDNFGLDSIRAISGFSRTTVKFALRVTSRCDFLRLRISAVVQTIRCESSIVKHLSLEFKVWIG